MVCAFEWSSPNILRPGTLPSQHYNNNLFKKNLNNVRKRICFSGFKLNMITILNIQDRTQQGDRRGGGHCPLEKTIFTIF
jgi:hypothetical protein